MGISGFGQERRGEIIMDEFFDEVYFDKNPEEENDDEDSEEENDDLDETFEEVLNLFFPQMNRE